ncbi:YggS family pyridoxal phosphate-dependent enzyme [Thermocrinis jamiesonii]|uniref:YggS family pyridoxal phosphate-dependent enzyme n=1 Tax=Thermocrinis jamiesonii TaxID=1302351 RepID=UPI00049670BB|nr:YggS family pyridoxal phosphate-dependent enzyme [Thermocrinis jamiesonii]
MVCQNVQRIEERILQACQRSGRSREEIILLGASKYADAEKIRQAYQCGVKVFGESRAQDFLKKLELLKDLPIDWHFIGRLQTNKVKYIIDKVSLIHSVDRPNLAEEINKRAEKIQKVQDVLIEVNVGGEETKGGVSPEELKNLFEYCLNLKNIRVLGLMAIPPYEEDPEKVRPYFIKLRKLKEMLEKDYGIKLPHLSMGMSNDFEVAVEEGATILRIGSALFS